MTDHLRLRLEGDGDGSAELFVEAQSKGFAGAGSAWFGTEQILDLGTRLQTTFPISSSNPIELEGGFWSSSKRGTLEQRHVALRFYPIGTAGKVGVRVQFSTPLHDGDRPESQSLASFELHTDYESIRKFGVLVATMANGDLKAAELEFHVG